MIQKKAAIRAAEENDIIQDTIRSLRFEDMKLDRASDPMGMDYEWLTGPQTPFDEAYNQLVNYSALRWQATVGPAMRRLASRDTMFSGNQEMLLDTFVNDRFPRLCEEAGEEGFKLMKLLKKYGDRSRGVVEEVDRFLSRQSELTELSRPERIALALIVIDRYGPKPQT